MKNTFASIMLFVFLLSAITACVPTRKFKDAEARFNACEDKNNELRFLIAGLLADTTQIGKDYRQLEREKKLLETTSTMEVGNLNDALRKKAEELTNKEKLLADRETRLRDLQGVISRKDSLVNLLRSRVTNALTGFPKDELTVEIKNGKVYVSLSDKLLFPSGSTAVEPKGKDALKKLAEVLEKNPDIEIQIEGHTDNVAIRPGTRFEDNWDLSVLRATSITRILTAGFVDPKRISPSGRSEYFPVASNETAEGKSKNRRTEIILSPKLDELFQILEAN